MELNVNKIEGIKDRQSQIVHFMTGKKCWGWDEMIEATVTFIEGFDLYLNEMSEEDRNNADKVQSQKDLYTVNTIDSWIELLNTDDDMNRRFSRWHQIETGCAFTVEHIAEVLKVTPTTIRKRIKKLGIKKPGDNKFGKWEFCRDEFDHLIELMAGGNE